MSLRLVFMGTPDFSVPALSEILGAGHEVAAVYSRAPVRAGRGMELRLSPVHAFAEKNGLPVFMPKSLKGKEEQEMLRGIAPDVIVVVAYGMILPQAVLDIPPLGCLNVHASLLPRWRGAAPIQRAIMAGDSETGVMVMKMEAGLDTGPVAMMEKIALPAQMTAGELHDALSLLGGDLLHRALSALERGGLYFTPQPEADVTYAQKIDKAEARIDWGRSADEVHNHIRGLSPFPGAWFEHQGERVKVLCSETVEANGTPGMLIDDALTIACGSGAIRIVQAQRAGKQPMSAEEFARGRAIPAGTVLA